MYLLLHCKATITVTTSPITVTCRKRASNKKNAILENTPAESIEDNVPITISNGNLTEHTTADSGNYGSVGVTDEMLDVSATDM